MNKASQIYEYFPSRHITRQPNSLMRRRIYHMLATILTMAAPIVKKVVEAGARHALANPIIKEVPTALGRLASTANAITGAACEYIIENPDIVDTAINYICDNDEDNSNNIVNTNHYSQPIKTVDTDLLINDKILQKQDYTYFCNLNIK